MSKIKGLIYKILPYILFNPKLKTIREVVEEVVSRGTWTTNYHLGLKCYVKEMTRLPYYSGKQFFCVTWKSERTEKRDRNKV